MMIDSGTYFHPDFNRAMIRKHFFNGSVSSSLFYLYIYHFTLVRLGVETLDLTSLLDFFIFLFYFSPQLGSRPSQVSTLSFGWDWQITRKVLRKKLHFFRKYKGCVIFENLLRCCCYFRDVKKTKNFRKNRQWWLFLKYFVCISETLFCNFERCDLTEGYRFTS